MLSSFSFCPPQDFVEGGRFSAPFLRCRSSPKYTGVPWVPGTPISPFSVLPLCLWRRLPLYLKNAFSQLPGVVFYYFSLVLRTPVLSGILSMRVGIIFINGAFLLIRDQIFPLCKPQIGLGHLFFPPSTLHLEVIISESISLFSLRFFLRPRSRALKI